MVAAEVDQRRAPLRARAVVSPALVGLVRGMLGSRVSIGPPGADGRVEVELRGSSAEALAGELAGFGAGLEVLDPPEVRQRLARIGAELSQIYGAV